MFIVVTPGYPPCANFLGTHAECLRYILANGMRKHAWLEPF